MRLFVFVFVLGSIVFCWLFGELYLFKGGIYWDFIFVLGVVESCDFYVVLIDVYVWLIFYYKYFIMCIFVYKLYIYIFILMLCNYKSYI